MFARVLLHLPGAHFDLRFGQHLPAAHRRAQQYHMLTGAAAPIAVLVEKQLAVRL